MRRGDQAGEDAEATVSGSGATVQRSSEEPTVIAGDRPAGSGRAPALDRGSVLGRYVVLSPLGSGAMGAVFLAYDPRLERRVALKLLHGVPTESQRRRFEREARAMAKIAHPHVVPVFDFGTRDDRVFLAMELVQGQDLRRRAQEHRLGWQESLRLMQQAGQGLAAAHAAGLVHRDFKPANVMVDATGQALVTDFGLVGESGEHSEPEESSDDEHEPVALEATRLTETGMVLGTPAYMAPEQYGGGPVDARTDQYAFCVTLFELLYGARPFQAVNALMLEDAKLHNEIQVVRRREVPRGLLRVLRRGLAVSPDDRWPHMQALLGALEAVTRRRRWIVATTLAGVAASGLGAWAMWPSPPSPCVTAGDELAWWGEPRAAVQASLDADDRQRWLAALDDHAERWAAVRTDLCHVQTSGQGPGIPLRAQVGCLAQQREVMAVVVDMVRTTALPEPLMNDEDGMLVAPERCAEPSLVPTELGEVDESIAAPLWRDAARLEARVRLADAGVELEPTTGGGAASLVAAAGEAGLPALAASVRMHEAIASPRDSQVVAMLLRVATDAEQAHDPRTVARAWVALVELFARRPLRAQEGLRWMGVARAAIVAAGNEPALRVRHGLAVARLLHIAERPADARVELGALRDEALAQGWAPGLLTRLTAAHAELDAA